MGRLLDRAGVGLAWACGLALIVGVGGVIGWLAWEGTGRLSISFLTTDPRAGSELVGVAGGIRGPIVGTLIVTAIGTGIAFPLGIATAVFLAEYGRPVRLARAVETAIDLLFGIPAVVFALFALAVFTAPWLSPLSAEVSSSGQAYGRSFLVAGIMMSLLALPLITRATQESIASVPGDLREASYALGKGKLATIRRVVIPGARSGIVTGAILGAGRVAADTAIAFLVLGGVIALADRWYEPSHWSQTLHGSGQTLTSYIYFASPAGEGNNQSAALGAAFVLIVLMLFVNAGIAFASRRGRGRADERW
jgi:phosphate transport system permease protein